MSERTLLPLFPLPNVVHFPETQLPLHVFEMRYRQLVEDLLTRAEDDRLIGMVTAAPGAMGIHEIGTAGRLIDVEPLDDGRSNIVLSGIYRFRVTEETSAAPYRRAWVERLPDPAPEADSSEPVVALRELVPGLARDMPGTFPLDRDAAEELCLDGHSEGLVNRLAADLDLATAHKLRLLVSDTPERAASLVRVLAGFRRTLDLLAPFRHLAGDGRRN